MGFGVEHQQFALCLARQLFSGQHQLAADALSPRGRMHQHFLHFGAMAGVRLPGKGELHRAGDFLVAPRDHEFAIALIHIPRNGMPIVLHVRRRNRQNITHRRAVFHRIAEQCNQSGAIIRANGCQDVDGEHQPEALWPLPPKPPRETPDDEEPMALPLREGDAEPPWWG